MKFSEKKVKNFGIQSHFNPTFNVVYDKNQLP